MSICTAAMLYLTILFILSVSDLVRPQVLSTNGHVHELLSEHKHLQELPNGTYEYYFSNGTFHTNFLPSSARKHRAFPLSFDARKQWPQCKSLRRVVDTGVCLAPLATIFISTLNDRTCIKTKGKVQTEYSLEDLVTCCTQCKPAKDMCYDTKNIFEAIKFWMEVGLVSGGDYKSQEGCKPYSHRLFKKKSTDKIKCKQECTNRNFNASYEEDKIVGDKLKVIIKGTADDLKSEIMATGPLITYAGIPEDFFYHKTGIFEDRDGPLIGVLPVKIFGWGIEEDVPYWWMLIPKITNIFVTENFVKMKAKTTPSRMEKTVFVLKVSYERSKSTTTEEVIIDKAGINIESTLLVLVVTLLTLILL